MKWFKTLTVAAIAISLVATSAGIANAAKSTLKGKIVVAGSTALLPLTLQAAKEFKKINPKVSIPASGAGSVTGPQSVMKGVADIGACDWDASKDVPGFKAFKGLVGHKVAVIPFTASVHKDNPVGELTTKQLIDIYTGKITNWKDVGGKDADIVVVARKFGSGTRVNFIDKALDGNDHVKTIKNYKEVGSSGEMKTSIETNENAIGYLDLAYVTSKMKALKIDGVEASAANVINGKYKVWGYGFYMTKGQPTGATKAFIEFIQSSKFQNGSLKKLKFIPISAIK